MLDLLTLEQERLEGTSHLPILATLLSSTDTTILHWVDEYYGDKLTSEHFYTASENWTLYCLNNDRHASFITQHAWHLLPTLFSRRALVYLLFFGTPLPKYSASELATILLRSYLATSPTPDEIARACEVVRDTPTARQLLEYCPSVIITPLAFRNGLRRRITAFVARPIDLNTVLPILTSSDAEHLSWLLRVCPVAKEYRWSSSWLVAGQEWELLEPS